MVHAESTMSLKKTKSSISRGRLPNKASVPKASTSAAVTATPLEVVARLEKQVVAASQADGDLNPLVDLLDYAKSNKKSKVRLAVLRALHQAFTTLVQRGKVIGKVRQGSEKQGDAQFAALTAVREWVKGRWNDYLEILAGELYSEDAANATAALNILMSLLKCTSEHISELQNPRTYMFDGALWKRIMEALTCSPQAATADVQAEFVNRYLNAYDDIRYHFLKSIAELVDSGVNHAPAFAGTVLFMLESLTTMPSEEEHLNAFWAGQPLRKTPKVQAIKTRKRKSEVKEVDTSTGIFDDSDDSALSEEEGDQTSIIKSRAQHELLLLTAHRKVFSNAWRSFLSLQLDEEEVKRILVMLHRQVMPNLLEPAILVDFLADCTDYGGTVALLALNGLFTLITKHRIEYPHFFTKLYDLLDQDVLHVRYRPRFMRMLDTFLASPLLPVALVASFIKRLARLCLTAPPPAIVAIIPFIYNQLKRHPALMTLIHSSTLPKAEAEYNDPYLSAEEDPFKTQAVDSSLWEIASMRRHYLASVSSLAKIFEEAFTKPNYNVEDFYDHTYSTMFATENTRPLKKALPLAPKPGNEDWKFLFPTKAMLEGVQAIEEAELELETKGDAVSRLWRFGS